MDLVALQLGVFPSGRQDDDAPLGVDLLGHLKSPLGRMAKNLGQHGHHVGVAVVVVVPEDHVIAWLAAGLLLVFGLPGGKRLLQGFGHGGVGIGHVCSSLSRIGESLTGDGPPHGQPRP